MYTALLSIIIFLAVLLVLVILAQNAKGGGLASQFGGSSASNIIGVKKTGDLLEKLTWGFMIGIMVISLGMSTRFVSPANAAPSNSILDAAEEQAPINSNPSTPDLNVDTTGAQGADTTTN
jgi:preprotein translocase subunit SecG